MRGVCGGERLFLAGPRVGRAAATPGACESPGTSRCRGFAQLVQNAADQNGKEISAV